MLELKHFFDIEDDVVPWLLKCRLTPSDENDLSTRPSRKELQIVHVEMNGHVLYTWKGTKGTTCIAAFDPHNKQNKLLYVFDKEVPLISCSVNMERTLLAVSFLQFTRSGVPFETFRPVSRCLTLLLEIHPVNNTKVLKAVDSHVRVQFVYPTSDAKLFPENHLLVISEDGCIEHILVRVIIEEGYRVTIQNPDRLHKDIVAEDILWAQWDTQGQRLFYIVEKENNALLTCIQFYPDRNYEKLLSFPLGFSLTVTKLRLINFGYISFQQEESSLELLNLQVFTNPTGTMSVCYSHPMQNKQEFTYSVILLHYGWRKTFIVSLEESDHYLISEPTFINIGYYVAVYMPGYFLHLINIQHPNLVCHSLFLSGKDAKVSPWNLQRPILSLTDSLLDCQFGKIYKAHLDLKLFLSFMHENKLDCHQLAAMHCAVFYLQNNSETEAQIIHWMCGLPVSGSIDLIQEFICGTLYRKAISETHLVDKLLPYSSLINWNGEIPGVSHSTETISVSVFRDTIQTLKGFWAELNRNVEFVKNLECFHYPWHNNSSRLIKAQLYSEMKVDERAKQHFRNILENAKTILPKVDTCSSEQKAVSFFQEEDRHQMVLIGLMVEKLKEHLMKYLHYIGKKKIDLIVNNYTVTLLECIWQIIDKIWNKYSLNTHILCLSNREKINSAEFVVFHMMTRVLEAAEGLFLPLPPGYHTVHITIGARCLPLHTLLHYIDIGVLHPTERFVTKLLEELDNSATNERFKFSIATRIPETIGQKICHLWDHPVSSSCIARNHVKTLLSELRTYEKSTDFSLKAQTPFESEFLPLTCLTRVLTEVEDQALSHLEESENVDAKFVEEVALKQTLTFLGLQNK
ncbi:gamma-secretase-activating protein isoform X1 [Chiloscyllium plagiosum]|uniref:gamma-secretase-activating protein isoform X1 n=1 Tax=Chiloscyllium plagiosum TaxID=36176 RepID=UPI001CB804FC|nr:gamma-secretase-activating protein isoform X1 [Chiloscyllium plagiosum]